MAPFYPEYCATCGRETLHWHRDPAGPGAPGGDCEQCGGFTPAVPREDGFWVTFTNMTDLSVAPAVGQYFLGKYQEANSAAEALDAALSWALGVMSRAGLPPHGIHIDAVELRTQARVIPDREVFHHGLGAAFNSQRQQA